MRYPLGQGGHGTDALTVSDLDLDSVTRPVQVSALFSAASSTRLEALYYFVAV
jgi:hypothetical protein